MSEKTFKATYTVADGYVGKYRPQSFTIRGSDIYVSPNMTDEQLEDAFYEMIDEDMRQKTSAEDVNAAEFVAWARSLTNEE